MKMMWIQNLIKSEKIYGIKGIIQQLEQDDYKE